MNDELEKAVTRQVGDAHPKNPKLVWTEYKPGKFDWRGVKSGDKKTKNDGAKPKRSLEEILADTPDDKLIQYASKEGNKPNLRQAAYDELVKRGVDVSDINMNNGKLGKMKQAFGNGDDSDFEFSDGTDIEDDLDDKYAQIPDKIKAHLSTWKAAVDLFEGQNIDYSDPLLIKNVFKGLKTKANRIEYDKFVSDVKRADEYYLTPDEEIFSLNESYAQALTTGAPFLIASGGAGVGKSYNFKLVAEICDLKQFDPASDSPEDEDWDWIEAPDVKSPRAFFDLLKMANGKTIVFDDADGIYGAGQLDMLKKVTNPSGKRIVGYQNETIEFTGQIVSITNKNSSELTENEDLKAVYSRADKKDIYFTKEEQMHFIKARLHDMSFDALDRLPNPADDIAEREDVFKLLQDNIDKIDPMKFNARSLKDAITAKRKSELTGEMVKKKGALAAKVFGGGSDWKRTILRELTKGNENELSTQVNSKMSLEKALQIFNL